MCILPECLHVLQVWYQRELVPLEMDILGDTKALEGKGKQFWQWHVRGLEYLNHYLSQVMEVGNELGRKLRKKMEGGPSKASFGGIMVRMPC